MRFDDAVFGMDTSNSIMPSCEAATMSNMQQVILSSPRSTSIQQINLPPPPRSSSIQQVTLPAPPRLRTPFHAVRSEIGSTYCTRRHGEVAHDIDNAGKLYMYALLYANQLE